jgi:5-deoxy-5-amino-3-dehydroquinate synthase
VRRVTVGVEPAYDVVVGPDALSELDALRHRHRQIAVVTQPGILDALGARAESVTRDALVLTVEHGEATKSLGTVERVCSELARGGILRGDAVVALGGGVVGDTGGFAAAIYHRGIAVVQAPTSLLAQVDAAIGGKTAVNLPEGKNLVGAFHQPVAVLADTATLQTLPASELRNGLGEVAKYALMPEGSAIVDLLRLHTDRVLDRDPEVLEVLVAECAAIKAAVVAGDPHERSGARATLNYGHTLAHALETTSVAGGEAGIAHGEAVAIGLVFAVNLALALERVGLDAVDRVHGVVAGLGLPVSVPGGATREDLLQVMKRDKKAKGGLTFVLPGPDGLELVDDPPARALDAAFAAVEA